VTARTRIAFLIAGIAGTTLLVAHVGIAALLVDVRRTGWTLLPIVVVWAVVYAMNTIAWRLLLDDATVPFGRAYAISISAFALNYVTPVVALGGEPLRIAAAAAWVGRPRATASVVAFRVVHTAGQIGFWLLGIPAAFVLLPRTTLARALLTLVALVLVLSLALLAVALRARTVERLLGLVTRAPLVGREIVARLERHHAGIRALDAALAALVDERPTRLALAFLVETASRFVAALEFLLVARAAGAPVSYGAAVLISGFSQLVMNVLFFVPFEVGAKEGSLLAIFALLGHAPRIAVASAVVSRLRELAWIGIGLAVLSLGGRPTDASPSADPPERHPA
jgi:uncharacterized protein (TIRG00374 family)